MNLDPASSLFVTGTPQDQERARAQFRKEQRLRIAHDSGRPELRRADLRFDHHYVVHEPTGALYMQMRGEVASGYYDNVDAYFVNQAGEAVFLQRPPGPQTLDELSEARAEREARRAQQARAMRIRR